MPIRGGGKIQATLASGGSISGTITSGATLTATLGNAAPGSGSYSGPYTAIPTQATQVFSTAGKTMLRNFVVEPIPSNYGLVAWNGIALTVS